MLKKLILLFILTFSLSHSQDLIRTYKDYIPQEVFQVEDYLKTVKVNLEVNSEIHPELNYYYLTMLDYQLNNPNKDLYKEYQGYYNLQKRNRINEKIEWLDWQIERLKKEDDKSTAEDVIEYFNEFYPVRFDIVSDKEYQVQLNDNLKVFFIYIYRYNLYDEIYDSTMNYSEKLKEYENNILSEDKEIYEKLTTSVKNPKYPLELIDRMISNWYLYDTEGNCGVRPYKNAMEIMKNYDAITEKEPKNNTIFLSFQSNKIDDYIYSVPLKNTSGTTILEDEFTLPSTNKKLGLFFEYTFRLNESKLMFNRINVGAGFLLGVDLRQDPFASKYSTAPPLPASFDSTFSEYYFITDYQDSYLKSSSNYNFVLKVNTDILNILPNLYFSIGCITGIQLTKYDINYKVNYNYYQRNAIKHYIIGTGTYYWELKQTFQYSNADEKQETLNKTKFIFYPTISLTYEITTRYKLRAEFFPDYLSLNFGYSFNF